MVVHYKGMMPVLKYILRNLFVSSKLYTIYKDGALALPAGTNREFSKGIAQVRDKILEKYENFEK